MSKITINGIKIYNKDIPNMRSVSFNHLGHKVHAAQKIERLLGIFVSQPVEGDSNLVSWKEVSWIVQKALGTDVFVYLKSSDTVEGLQYAEWTGPYLNAVNDIANLKGRYLQFMVVLSNDGTTSTNYQYINVASTPIFNSIDISYFSSATAAKFYSTTFNLGFVPKHVLLTYNGDIGADSIVRFAISGFDSVDTKDYQYINPNKIEELSGLSILSDRIKLMIEMIGDSATQLTIHEVALMFSGDQQLMLNDMSSSSESSSSTEVMTTSSSSESSSSESSSSSSSYCGIGCMIIEVNFEVS